MEKYGFVYIWYDRKYKRYYIGSHWGTENDGYVCSSNWMNKAYKRRKEDFKRRILTKVTSSKKDLLLKEQEWLDKIDPLKIKKGKDSKYYNLNLNVNDYWHTYDESFSSIKEKISIRTKEAMKKDDVRKKFEEGLKNRDTRSSDLEVRQKRRESMLKTMEEKFPVKNRKSPLTQEQRFEYYSNKAKDMHSNMTEEQKKIRSRNLSKSLKGYKMRLGQTNSEEHRKNISHSLKGKIHKRHNIMINGIFYESTIKAEKDLGISASTINRRLNSNNYENWIRISD